MNLELDLLRAFVAVVDTGGFTRAAERVHLTQSTISQQIKRLEENVGHSLLIRDRSMGGAQVTEEGELLLGYARRLLAISAEAEQALRRPTAPKTVRLGLPEDFAGRRLIELLSGFSSASPHLRLDTVSGWSFELRRLLDNGDIDLALVKREPSDAHCLGRWPEALVWVAGMSGELDADPVPLAMFPQGCIYRQRATRAIEATGRMWRIAYTSQGLIGVQAAVASGVGISLLPMDAVLAEHRRLTPADGFPEQSPSELALIARSPRLDAPARALADFLVRNVGSIQQGTPSDG
ncbi:MAG: LysR family transcriptional regulator [Mesorhizobium sp.]|nr:LysR family transcriptional regulator [Mesorhizobium sp.]